MQKLMVFNNITLDGYFTDQNNGIGWAHENADDELNAFTEENAKSAGGLLLFGRKTYEMMVSFWPTPEAKKQMPKVADGINRAQKIVFSRTLRDASWTNTRLVKTGLVEDVRRLKEKGDMPMVLMGSGTIVAQLAKEGLIDEYQLIVHPVVIGKGRTLFEGLEKKLDLERTNSRMFENGSVFITYRPKKR